MKFMKRSQVIRLFPLVAIAALSGFSLHAAPGALKILKFEADWCGPCQQMKPAFSAVSKSEGGVSFQTVDIDREPTLAERYEVKAVPTVVAVKDGKIVGRLVGLQSEAKLRKFVEKHR